jgi:hypothetical protein
MPRVNVAALRQDAYVVQLQSNLAAMPSCVAQMVIAFFSDDACAQMFEHRCRQIWMCGRGT